MSDTLRRRLAQFGGAATLVLAIDQATKGWAWDVLRGTAGVRVAPGLLHFQFALNTGGAFGAGAGHPDSRIILGVVGCAAVLLMTIAALRIDDENPLARFGLGIAAGGAAGNVIDRFVRVTAMPVRIENELDFHHLLEHGQAIADAVRHGEHWVRLPQYGVVDFIVVFYGGGKRWPAFNVADIALSVGGALLMVWLWRAGLEDEPEDADARGDLDEPERALAD